MVSSEHNSPQRLQTFGLATLMLLVAVAAVWFTEDEKRAIQQ